MPSKDDSIPFHGKENNYGRQSEGTNQVGEENRKGKGEQGHVWGGGQEKSTKVQKNELKYAASECVMVGYPLESTRDLGGERIPRHIGVT